MVCPLQIMHQPALAKKHRPASSGPLNLCTQLLPLISPLPPASHLYHSPSLLVTATSPVLAAIFPYDVVQARKRSAWEAAGRHVAYLSAIKLTLFYTNQDGMTIFMLRVTGILGLQAYERVGGREKEREREKQAIMLQ